MGVRRVLTLAAVCGAVLLTGFPQAAGAGGLAVPGSEGPPGPPARLPNGQLAQPPAIMPFEAGTCPPAPYGPQRYAPGSGRTVALTFDDGPGTSTPQILAVLQRYGVRATFFNLGQNSAALPRLVEQEAAAGDLLGNHTWNHPQLTQLTAAQQATQMDQASAEQRLITGSAPCVFRPPYGDYNATTLSLAQQRGMAVWLWSVDTEDWKARGSASSYWVNRIVSLAEQQGGALAHPVVLMHNQPGAGNPATVLALPTIITYFRDRGYTFVDLLGRSGPVLSCAASTTTRASASAPTTAGAASTTTSTLAPGTVLRADQSITSPGGQYRLVMQADGNLVEYTAGGHALWASGTADQPGAWAIMQADGNLVVYTATGRPLWASGTSGYPGAFTALQADANLVVYGGGRPLWANGVINSVLGSGERLRPGWYLQSPRGQCRLIMQADGNLVLYNASGSPLWASGTSGRTGAWAIMQADSNLVVYSSTGQALWASGTRGVSGAWLGVRDDGRAVITSPGGQVIWSTSG